MPREACRRVGNVAVRMRMHHTTFLLAAAAAAIAIATAPSASAAPSQQPCSGGAESTNCQRPGNVQVYTSPRALPRVFPHSGNPKWLGLGYNARWPVLGHNPRWQAFGYDPKYSGFQPRPSVLRAPQLPVSPDLQCPTPSPSTCTPRNPNATNTGGSTTYQTPGNAQLTAQIGLAAQQATQPQYPSLAGTTTHTGGSTMYQTPGDAQITAHPGPAAQNAPQQTTFFPLSDLPRL
ncbi:hypothetical protein C8E89_1331 [Mycolicibacterium moriokaense]|uniref:Secreted protein n=1 Tax=Mycolicibacterium moriokaense TaxID=39691 RepID=A0A318H7D6_9MYCO|nr:hypothetical protein C8E89_1331 [Mycolicibacterium moriokaense]